MSELSRREFLAGASTLGGVVICVDAADAIATPPSVDAPARNSRLESSDIVMPFMLEDDSQH